MVMKKVVTVETTRYPKEDFTGVLENYYIKYVEQLDANVLTLEFENPEDTEAPMELTIFGIDYLDRENDAGEITTGKGFGLGVFIDSLNAVGSDFMYDGEIHEVNFMPEIAGKTLDMDANPSKKITDEGEKTRQNWRIRKIIGSGDTPPPQTSSSVAAKPKTPLPPAASGDTREDWEALIISDEFYTVPHTHPEILRHLRQTMPDRKERAPYTESFKAVFAALIKDGVLMMPEEGKYQLVG